MVKMVSAQSLNRVRQMRKRVTNQYDLNESVGEGLTVCVMQMQMQLQFDENNEDRDCYENPYTNSF